MLYWWFVPADVDTKRDVYSYFLLIFFWGLRPKHSSRTFIKHDEAGHHQREYTMSSCLRYCLPVGASIRSKEPWTYISCGNFQARKKCSTFGELPLMTGALPYLKFQRAPDRTPTTTLGAAMPCRRSVKVERRKHEPGPERYKEFSASQ